MTPFSKLAEITRYAASAERRPFSVLVSSPVPTMGHATCFYFGGWNVLPSDVCAEFPRATFQRTDNTVSQ